MTESIQPFAVGDKVTSSWDPTNGDLIRTITDVRANPNFASGWAISADNGDSTDAKAITLIDSSWFFHAKLCAPL